MPSSLGTYRGDCFARRSATMTSAVTSKTRATTRQSKYGLAYLYNFRRMSPHYSNLLNAIRQSVEVRAISADYQAFTLAGLYLCSRFRHHSCGTLGGPRVRRPAKARARDQGHLAAARDDARAEDAHVPPSARMREDSRARAVPADLSTTTVSCSGISRGASGARGA